MPRGTAYKLRVLSGVTLVRAPETRIPESRHTWAFQDGAYGLMDVEDAPSKCDVDRGGPVLDIQFSQDALDVRLDGLFGDAQ